MKTLKVVSVEERTDKNGNMYKYIQLSTPERMKIINELGEEEIVRVESRTTAFNAYPESYLKDNNGKPIPQFGHNFKVGESVPGDVVTKEIEKQFIPSSNGTGKHTFNGVNGNWVDTTSVIVFGNTDDKEAFELKAKQTFKARGYTLKGEQMTPTPVVQSTVSTVQTGIAALANSDDELVIEKMPQAKVINKELKKETEAILAGQSEEQVAEANGAGAKKGNSNKSAGGNFGGAVSQ